MSSGNSIKRHDHRASHTL